MSSTAHLDHLGEAVPTRLTPLRSANPEKLSPTEHRDHEIFTLGSNLDGPRTELVRNLVTYFLIMA